MDISIEDMCEFLDFKPKQNDLVEQSKKVLYQIQNDNDITDDEKTQLMTYVKHYIKKISKHYSIQIPDTLFTDPIPAIQVHYERGTINPLKKRSIKRRIFVHTKFREDTNSPSTDFTLVLPNPIKHIVSMKLTSFEIRNGYYNISKFYNNDAFKIITYDFSNNEKKNEQEYTIKLERGFYTPELLADYLNNVYFVEENDLQLIRCYYDNVLGKFVFQRDFDEVPEDDTDNPVHRFEIQFIPEDKECSEEEFRERSLGWLMGFTKKVYTWDDYNLTGLNEHTSLGYVSEQVSQTDINYFLLNVNEYNHNYADTIIIPYYNHTMNRSENTLAKIQVTQPRRELISLMDTANIFLKREYMGPIQLDKLKIQLTDEYGRILDLNGADYSFTLEVEQLYTI